MTFHALIFMQFVLSWHKLTRGERKGTLFSLCIEWHRILRCLRSCCFTRQKSDNSQISTEGNFCFRFCFLGPVGVYLFVVFWAVSHLWSLIFSVAQSLDGSCGHFLRYRRIEQIQQQQRRPRNGDFYEVDNCGSRADLRHSLVRSVSLQALRVACRFRVS